MQRLFTQPKMYSIANILQRRDAKEVVKILSPNIKTWKNESNSTLLDIGTGSGDVLIDFVVPKLSENYAKVVGSDVSEEMINFSRDRYKTDYPRVEFKTLDISSENLKTTEQFDHVTSFYCLNFLQNQMQVFNNVYDLVKPGGDIMVLLIAHFHVISMLDLLATNPKWGPHLREVSSHASPYRFSNDPANDLKMVLEQSGFHNIQTVSLKKQFTYEKEQFNRFLKSWDQFKPGTPEKYYNELLDAMLQVMANFDMVKEDSEGTKVTVSYTNMMAYAQKKLL